MGYNLNKLRDELMAKNFADEGLVAWGQGSAGGILFGAVGGAMSGMYVISMIKGSKIAIIPFSNKEIKYSEGKAFDKSKIKEAKVSGFLGSTLKFTTVDGKTHSYKITQGASDVKEILEKLGF